MSQLSGLNQTQQAQSNTSVSDTQAAKNNVAKIEVSIANNLQGVFKLQGLNAPITQQLTMAQSGKMAQQPLIALLNQQSALVFLQNQQVTNSITLPPALLNLAQQWLKSDKGLTGKLPSELVTLLSSKIGLNASQLQHQILNASLKQSLLQLSFLQGEAIAELKLGTSTTQVASEQLEQMLQFMLPINNKDDASLLIQQQQTTSNEDGEDKLRFRLQFDLDRLGKLEVQVELKEFELSTICICDSPLLQQKVERYWPQLETRLSSLGFELSNQIKRKTRLDDKNMQSRASGLINVKV